MGFNPLQEKGMPIEKQFHNWSELNVEPFNRDEVDPYTQCRVITMNGIEVESIFFNHQFFRNTADMEVRRQLAMTRRVEQQQQKHVNWLVPGGSSPIETTIGYEQVAVDLTAWLARSEPDPYFKQVLEFALLEDFDHLYRYANLMDLMNGKKAERLTGPVTEIMPGRPTVAEHRHPYDDVRRPLSAKTADPLSMLHALTIVAAEQQTMNFYMNVGNLPTDPVARGLYLEIAQIEEQHVTHYGSMLDPTLSWCQNLVLHEYNECYLYYSFMQQEVDPRIKRIWEIHLDMEIEHLRLACELMERQENKDPTELLPKEMPEPVLFHSNIEYVRDVLANQVNLTGNLEEMVPVDTLPKDHRYFQYQSIVNGDGVPSEQVIGERIRKKDKDYRQEVKGFHPVQHLRQDEVVSAMKR